MHFHADPMIAYMIKLSRQTMTDLIPHAMHHFFVRSFPDSMSHFNQFIPLPNHHFSECLKTVEISNKHKIYME